MVIYMAESIRCSPETITKLLIGCTSTQNKKFLKITVSLIGHNTKKCNTRYCLDIGEEAREI